MKSFAILALFSFLLPPLTFCQPAASGTPLSLSVSVNHTTAGGKGTLAIMLTPGKDLYVKAKPGPEFAPDSAGPACVTSGLRFAKTADGRLDTNHPLELDFSIPDGTPVGTYRLAGTLRWLVCSDSAGWCRMDRRTMSVQLVVR
jgi:hypothetical protein